MTTAAEIEHYCNALLEISAFADYCPNGMQVDAGAAEVSRVMSGVTASQGLIDAAVEWGAQLLLVHHGYFWKGEPLPLIGVKGRRVRTLMRHGVSLLAYHLPLDAHPELGNNRTLADALGVRDPAPVAERALLWQGVLSEPSVPGAFAQQIAAALGREPLHLAGGPPRIGRVAWCSGGGHGMVEQAAALGAEAYITGEPAEQSLHLARELGIHFFAAGHHATERFGVRALGDHLAARFGVEHRFQDLPNPV